VGRKGELACCVAEMCLMQLQTNAGRPRETGRDEIVLAPVWCTECFDVAPLL